jgi:hypothetical protein
MSFSLQAPAHAIPGIDLIPDPNLEDLNDIPDLSVDPNAEDLDDLNDMDLDDNSVIEDYEWSYVFERDLDTDGVLDFEDPDYSEEYYLKRMPGYDYDGDGLGDDDRRDRIYGRDQPDPDPDPDPDPEVQYRQYQEQYEAQYLIQQYEEQDTEISSTSETVGVEKDNLDESFATSPPKNSGGGGTGFGWMIAVLVILGLLSGAAPKRRR